MLVVLRKSQQPVVLDLSDGFKGLLQISVLDIQLRKVKLGFDVKDNADCELKLWKPFHAGGQSYGPESRRATPHEEMNRWEDDGGTDDQTSGRVVASCDNGAPTGSQ